MRAEVLPQLRVHPARVVLVAQVVTAELRAVVQQVQTVTVQQEAPVVLVAMHMLAVHLVRRTRQWLQIFMRREFLQLLRVRVLPAAQEVLQVLVAREDLREVQEQRVLLGQSSMRVASPVSQLAVHMLQVIGTLQLQDLQREMALETVLTQLV